VPVVLFTHETEEASMRRALDRIASLNTVGRAAAHDPESRRCEPETAV